MNCRRNPSYIPLEELREFKTLRHADFKNSTKVTLDFMLRSVTEMLAHGILNSFTKRAFKGPSRRSHMQIIKDAVCCVEFMDWHIWKVDPSQNFKLNAQRP
jgi:hypothetical protein